MSLEEDLFALEQATLASPGASAFLAAVKRLRVLLANNFAGIGEEDEARAIVLRLQSPLLEGVALAAVSEAFGIGRASGLDVVDAPRGPLERSTLGATPSKRARKPLIGLDASAVELVGQAQALAAAGTETATLIGPILALGALFSGRVTQAVNAGGNEGVRAVATAADVPVVWIAETNACVHCLAYAGHVVEGGKKFPGGLTFGPKSYFPDAIATPPRHPNCRCTLEPLNDQSYADGLRREAERSVLRGFSLETESMAVRIAAADLLLKRGVNAPKSVKAYAAKSVKAGRFPTRDRPLE
jgi:hypothetical protein